MKKRIFATVLAGLVSVCCLMSCGEEEEQTNKLPVSKTEWAQACEVDWDNFKYIQETLTEMDVQGEKTQTTVETEFIATDTARYRKWTYGEGGVVGLITEEYYAKRSDGVYSCRYSNKVSEGNYEWELTSVDWDKIFVEDIVVVKGVVASVSAYYENLKYDEEKDVYFFKEEQNVTQGSESYGMTGNYEIQLKDGKVYTVKANTTTNVGRVMEQEIFITFGAQALELPEFH